MKTLLNNGTVIDGVGGVVEAGSVLMENGVIVEVGPRRSSAQIDSDTKVVDVEGATILPGLMNLHVHIQRRHLHRKTDNEPFRTGTPALEAQPDEVRMIWAIKNCWAELLEGITTFRDTGSGAALSNKVRWAFDSGVMPGPRFVTAGEGIAITGGHGAHYPKQAALWADGADGVRQAVRYQLHLGADWIKLMASSGLGGMPIFEDPRCTEMTLEEMRAGVREAHARRARVTVHAFYSEAVQAAIVSGVDCIEHGTSLDEKTIELMKKHRTCYVPTMSNMVELCRREEVSGDPRTADLIREASVTPHVDSVARAHAAGIRIGTGSDTMGQLNKEIEMLHSAGLSTMECIKAATSVAADILGMKNEVGSLEPGKCADVLVVNGNPLDDLATLRNVRAVYKSGNHVTSDWLVGSIKESMSHPTLSTARPFYRRVSERYMEHEYMTVINGSSCASFCRGLAASAASQDPSKSRDPMLFLAIITNKPDVDELRRTHYDAHIDYLKRLDSSVLLSASAQTSLDAVPHELVWIISAESVEDATRIVEEDPFWSSGVRQASRISFLRKSIPDRSVLI